MCKKNYCKNMRGNIIRSDITWTGQLKTSSITERRMRWERRGKKNEKRKQTDKKDRVSLSESEPERKEREKENRK